LMHCHYLLSVEGAAFGMPEVTLPVVPGMEGCHWPFRKTHSENWPKLLQLLLEGHSVNAQDAVGWLIDYAGPIDESLQMVWKIITDGDHGLTKRTVEEGILKGIRQEASGVTHSGHSLEAAGKAIFQSILNSCESTLSEAITIQAKHSADFMISPHCRKGVIGAEFTKTMTL